VNIRELAFLRALAAGYSAIAAMLNVVFIAFIGAAPANFSAHFANRFGVLAAQAHHLHCGAAHGSTLHA